MCVVGMDTRPSSPMMKEVAQAALMKNGIDVMDLGVAATPAVFREARKYGAGIVITSSHNPMEWNGIKFIMEGRGINEQELLKITDDVVGVGSTKIGMHHNITTKYVDEAAKLIGRVKGTPEVVVDVGGGAAAGFAPELLSRIGCGVRVINENPVICDRGPDPTDDSLEGLVQASYSKDIGFAFDLDGDRLVVVREGIKQASDLTLGLGVVKALEMGRKRFVLSADTSVVVEKIIVEHGGSVHRSKVGEANVMQAMLEHDAQAGGEGSSGGFILPEFNYCRDGMLTSGLITSMLEGSELNEVLKYIGRYHQIRTKINMDQVLHESVMAKLESWLSREYSGSEISMSDGIKCMTGKGDDWVLIRKSNTEDTIRVSAESENEYRCQEMVRGIMEAVQDAAAMDGR